MTVYSSGGSSSYTDGAGIFGFVVLALVLLALAVCACVWKCKQNQKEAKYTKIPDRENKQEKSDLNVVMPPAVDE